MKSKTPNPKSFGLTKTGTQTYSPPLFGRKIRMIGKEDPWLSQDAYGWSGHVTLKDNATLSLRVENYPHNGSPCVWTLRLETTGGFYRKHTHYFKAKPSKAEVEQVLRKFERDTQLAAQALTAITETI